ncbi:uncharacterized protein LOC131326414 isoform X2 [Rhododendron vialii]|uniref:uncharacterized protein LOC131326414 isoform X2 n=1 Tax=Rhododendron vialii TaxID=182163 RepID=UPI00265F4605|nr:uncharacterized protein LOC131326414 isoform X2 [Rhododendron vialii]
MNGTRIGRSAPDRQEAAKQHPWIPKSSGSTVQGPAPQPTKCSNNDLANQDPLHPTQEKREDEERKKNIIRDSPLLERKFCLPIKGRAGSMGSNHGLRYLQEQTTANYLIIWKVLQYTPLFECIGQF